MFVGHYGISFAARRYYPSVPLWVFFVAVQLLDVIWAPLVLLGIEHVRIVPGITATNPLDLYHMPYTHSLVAAILWSAAAYGAWRLLRGRSGAQGPGRAGIAGIGAAGAVAAAVFSHWILDAIVHRPDMPIYDDALKVGLGLWNYPVAAFGLEASLLLGGVALYLGDGSRRRTATWVMAVVMLVIHLSTFFGAPPPSAAIAAAMGFAAYLIFAAAAAWLERGAGDHGERDGIGAS